MDQDPSIAEPERRRRVLDAALETFWRYGFRKTSMDEVARAADISRQGLYFYFGNKEDLFRETMRKSLDDALAAVSARLAQADAPIEDRLVDAMDGWYGRHVGQFSSDNSDLMEKSGALLGTMYADYYATFQARAVEAIAASPLTGRLASLGLTAADVVQTLHGCGVGWKHMPITRAEFARRARVAVTLICR
jgi:AcrR family transcriptional regulator